MSVTEQIPGQLTIYDLDTGGEKKDKLSHIRDPHRGGGEEVWSLCGVKLKGVPSSAPACIVCDEMARRRRYDR